MGKITDTARGLLRFLKLLLPVIFISVVIYMFYLRFARTDVEKTADDLEYITKHINTENSGALYKNFDADLVTNSGWLPLDLKTVMTNHGYIVKNRFGSAMIFTEAYRTKEEKDYYRKIRDSGALFSQYYKGKGAYIISFPDIGRSACMMLAQTDWKKQLPHFLGISVGSTDKNNPRAGIDRLDKGLLQGIYEIEYDGSDKAFVANRPLQYAEAFKSCRCFIHNNCIVSLKFF